MYIGLYVFSIIRRQSVAIYPHIYNKCTLFALNTPYSESILHDLSASVLLLTMFSSLFSVVIHTLSSIRNFPSSSSSVSLSSVVLYNFSCFR